MCIHSQNEFFFEMCIHSQNVKTVWKVSWVFFHLSEKHNCKQSQLTKVCKICIVTSKSFWWGRVNYNEIYKALEFVSVVRNLQFITPLEAVAYTILDIAHKSIKLASINETKKSKNNLPYFLIYFPRKLFFFVFGNPKVTVHKAKGHST